MAEADDINSWGNIPATTSRPIPKESYCFLNFWDFDNDVLKQWVRDNFTGEAKKQIIEVLEDYNGCGYTIYDEDFKCRSIEQIWEMYDYRISKKVAGEIYTKASSYKNQKQDLRIQITDVKKSMNQLMKSMEIDRNFLYKSIKKNKKKMKYNNKIITNQYNQNDFQQLKFYVKKRCLSFPFFFLSRLTNAAMKIDDNQLVKKETNTNSQKRTTRYEYEWKEREKQKQFQKQKIETQTKSMMNLYNFFVFFRFSFFESFVSFWNIGSRGGILCKFVFFSRGFFLSSLRISFLNCQKIKFSYCLIFESNWDPGGHNFSNCVHIKFWFYTFLNLVFQENLFLNVPQINFIRMDPKKRWQKIFIKSWFVWNSNLDIFYLLGFRNETSELFYSFFELYIQKFFGTNGIFSLINYKKSTSSLPDRCLSHQTQFFFGKKIKKFSLYLYRYMKTRMFDRSFVCQKEEFYSIKNSHSFCNFYMGWYSDRTICMMFELGFSWDPGGHHNNRSLLLFFFFI